jgi:hypothetical protein
VRALLRERPRITRFTPVEGKKRASQMLSEDLKDIERVHDRLQEIFSWTDKLPRRLPRRKINDLVSCSLDDIAGITWRNRKPPDAEKMSEWRARHAVPDAHLDAADELIERAVTDFDAKDV